MKFSRKQDRWAGGTALALGWRLGATSQGCDLSEGNLPTGRRYGFHPLWGPPHAGRWPRSPALPHITQTPLGSQVPPNPRSSWKTVVGAALGEAPEERGGEAHAEPLSKPNMPTRPLDMAEVGPCPRPAAPSPVPFSPG